MLPDNRLRPMTTMMYARSENKAYGWDDAVRRGREQHRKVALTVTCRACLALFSPTYGHSRLRVCTACAAHRRQSQKRVHRLARKAMQRAATVEKVNPLKVFDRDGWECRLCGIPTPRVKRGTYEFDAPELDHIIPLAKGGEHSYRNTQCTCRRCNSLKSDHVGPLAPEGEGVSHLSDPKPSDTD